MKPGRKTATPVMKKPAEARVSGSARRPGKDGASQARRTRAGATARRPHEPRGPRQGPQTAPAARPAEKTVRAKTTSQAKARSKARKAKAPKAVRVPLKDRLIARLAGVDLRPQALLARVPFVVLIIGALGLGLGITLWLSTDSAQRSYQLGGARELNSALSQQKEALERDVLEAQSAPALAEAARELGMIPSRDTSHLVQDPAGNWIVIGQPKPAQGAPPPPLNTKLPEEKPLTPPTPAPPPAAAAPKPGASPEIPVRLAPSTAGLIPHAVTGSVLPGPGPVAPAPADTLAAAAAAAGAPQPPTVEPMPPVPAAPGGLVASVAPQ